MAEKAAEKKPDAAAPAAGGDKKDAKKDGHGGGAGGGGIMGLLTKLPVMMGGVMIIEAVVLFAGFKFLGSGASSAEGANIAHLETGEEGGHGDEGHGEGGHGGEGQAAPIDKRKTVEINVLDFKAPNKLSGRTFLYDVSIYLVTKNEFAEQVKQTIKDRDALIKDRIRTIIAQSDPEKLGGGSEPGLETLRRQVKYQLDEIVGEQMISEVLIPRCIPFRTDY
jgi:flagellar basal body-associated protein FliL